MKKRVLSINQRIVAVLFYILTFLFACRFLSDNWLFLTDTDSRYNVLFISSALLLIFGAYIAEPYFTKPVDVIINSTALVLALFSIKDPNSFTGYWVLFYSSISLVVFSIILILTSQNKKQNKLQRIFFWMVTKIGQSKLVFSCMYILTIISYFYNKPLDYLIFISFWVIFITQFIVEDVILFFSKLLLYLFDKDVKKQIIGEAIGCENPFLYNIENDSGKHIQTTIKKGILSV